ncbi:A/G-specific adenine glycosylase [Sulfurovum sp.]|jgi:A/G-specific adenine glycosylase|uniref:A/G-specific adenine glycosylase n=1 Tax=Sulfurovum sp. TaxID=1969726 RepID=UPI002A362DD8|nr:A/G-specific adenine glycosylase [Sulfurovum sp.]MDD2452044.1 A/G-specific adenine glycosylase [Sulfurovum sp.]MDD3500514.1 A/G-specific adenine glycosylase [Sulfurovum sp.]MDY0402848.1 A/G-specific adenine glycosylase [Sulfurovum sp.]
MKNLHLTIRTWYRDNGRHTLPWRNTEEPYYIYLSEVMLQQTQVKTVLERYYFPFIERFPTLKALGEAELDEVLKAWEGLGYYTRARNLHKTATLVSELPADIDALIRLPGIGKNTAHAIAAFAFRQPVPIMEANVKRILCRLHKLENPTERELWGYAYSLVDRENPFDYNQAMMDIGATVCLPKSAECERCPLESICQGKEAPWRYPVKKKRTVPTREEHVVVHSCNGRLSLHQRSGKFLHGLWGFESIEVPPCAAEYLGEVSHTYTHFKLNCKVYLYHESIPEQENYFNLDEIRELAISKVDEKILLLVKRKEETLW